ncbi:MAG: acetyl-CoA C-acyltransferase [Alphaproteobacteria bacterium]|nr:acetyl-CoA C-acyltransferase [Alphaproteobacteria bacterium]
MPEDQIVIVAAKRTPLGAFQGAFKNITAPQLGGIVIQRVLDTIKISPGHIDEVLMGCVLSAGLGQAPARQAALGAGLANSTHCVTVNKVCGSGMKSIMLAYDRLKLNEARTIIAGGMESMSNAPYLLPKARNGYRFGHGQILDHMALDGLEDAYQKNTPMGIFAENTAQRYQFSRQAQDAFVIESGKRALQAIQTGAFRDEITAVTIKDCKDTFEVIEDEQPYKVLFDKIPNLKPVFREGGTVTAASSSSLSDGAAAIILMRAKDAQMQGLNPLAILHGHVSHSHEPEWFTTAPINAIQKLCQKLSWSLQEIDLFEINEAFAVVTMAAIKELGLSHEKVNIHGGACALGHPIGATGARVIVTLLYALRRHNLKKGIASVCIGGGEATAIGLEVL